MNSRLLRYRKHLFTFLPRDGVRYLSETSNFAQRKRTLLNNNKNQQR